MTKNTLILDTNIIGQIKKATGIVARYDARRDEHKMEIIIQKNDAETRTEVFCKGNVTKYEDMGKTLSECVAVRLYLDYDEQWKSIRNFVRKGDELQLSWSGGNDNQYMKAAGLHHVHVDVVVIRNGKGYFFRLADVVCPDGSNRMFQYR